MRRRSYLTVRNLPADIAAALEQERRRRGGSLNQTVVNALRRGLGLGEGCVSNGLASLAGKWSEEEFAAFQKTVQDLHDGVDETLRV
jgi:plasmid stability protein